MTTKRKVELVQRLSELLSQSDFIIVTDYRGLSVVEISELRRLLRNAGTEFHVVKNTLAELAAKNTGKAALTELLTGPTALAFGHKEIPQLAKVIADYIRSSKSALSIKGGIFDGRVLSPESVSMIATLPPIEVLRARLVGLISGPIYSLQNVLSANLYGLNSVLNARIQQLGGVTNV